MNEITEKLADNIEKVIIGKRAVVYKLIAAMLAGGHVLIEDVPGVGKTQLVTALAASVSGSCNRIQFTPDIMPSDIMGYTMINPETKKTEYRQGAAVCNFLLADEINRASPKAQSALLEIMEELQISVDGNTYPLPRPFMALATQNPVETYGTYHLPEAQMDRFIMKLTIGYPSFAEEMEILDRKEKGVKAQTVGAVMQPEDIMSLRERANAIIVHPIVRKYIIDLVNATRSSEYVTLGASPRGSIALFRTSKAMALINGREYVTPEDVREVASDVLAHRLMLSPKGKSVMKTQENVIADVINAVGIDSAQ